MLLSAFLLGGPGATAGVGSGENPSARSYVLSQSVVSDSMDCSLPGSSVHGTVACQAPLYQGGLPFPSIGDLPDPGTEPRSLALQAQSLLSEPPGKP